MTRARVDFTSSVEKVLVERVAFRCSKCEPTTSGPNSDPEKSVNMLVRLFATSETLEMG